ncbi:MAG: winged helix-turn-helix transcriptional regulator, partial [Clostridiaceae bacterium]|nr:winged helix-turn-helix transcriptional regulator [Clostridiaceae bacterium]
MEKEILSILANNSRLTNEQIAVMLGRTEDEVNQA